MTNSGDRETHNNETKQESYTDPHTNLTRTSETVNSNPNLVNSYRNGYTNGQETERNYQQANLAARDNENASVGLLLGIFLTSVAGLMVGAFWYFNQPKETVIKEPQPVVTPQPQQTTIIERTTEVPVVVPQPQVPTVTIPSPPDINITVPPQQPATSGTQATPQQDNANTSETTVPQGSDKSNETSNSSSSTTGDIGTDKSNPR